MVDHRQAIPERTPKIRKKYCIPMRADTVTLTEMLIAAPVKQRKNMMEPTAALF